MPFAYQRTARRRGFPRLSIPVEEAVGQRAQQIGGCPKISEAGADTRATMRDYARDFGLTFQITDDLIDTVSSAGVAGKSVGKDEAQGKATLVSIFGVEGARAKAAELAARAAGRLEGFGAAAELLRALPYRLLDRDR